MLISNTYIEIVSNFHFESIKLIDLYERGFKNNIQILGKDFVNDKLTYSELISMSYSKYNLNIIKLISIKGNELVCSADQKIYTQNKGYINAVELETNDILITGSVDEPDDFVKSVDLFVEKQIVFNFQVAENFFANNILVR